MRTIVLTSANRNNINNTITALETMLTNDIVGAFMRRDINERENRKLDTSVTKMHNALSRFKLKGNVSFDLKPIIVKVVGDRCDIISANDLEPISTIKAVDANSVLDEIRSVSKDWAKYIDCMIVLNAVNDESFNISPSFKLVPKKNLKLNKMFNVLGIDSSILNVY